MGLQFGVSYKGGESEYVRIRRWPFSIGRHPANDLCLANSALTSRRHVRIDRQDDEYILTACGRNPTFLNGQRLPLNEPVGIRPGDRIELPDYLLEFRDTARDDTMGATINVEAISTSMIIVRRVASMLGTSRWTVEAIHQWLTAGGEREIWIRHHHIALCLPHRLDSTQIEERLNQFDALIAELDPQALRIELVDPRARAHRTE